MIRAAMFDMDGLLIDSEPLWNIAIRAAFEPRGVMLTRERCRETIGFRLDELVAHWAKHFPKARLPYDELEKDIIDRVVGLIREKGVAKSGVDHALSFMEQRDLPIALVSGSYYTIINVVLDALGIRERFDLIYSAQDEPYGKPHPGIYLSAAAKLGVDPRHCVAFEDSFSGLLSAKAAKMKCIAVPDSSFIRDGEPDHRLVIADIMLDSLGDLGEDQWKRLHN